MRQHALIGGIILKRYRKGGNNLRLTSFLQNGELTVVLTGEIDHHRAKSYIQAITSKIEAYTPAICVLDFQEVTFMDSSGIAVIINALRCMTRFHGQLQISGIRNQPIRVLRASGIDKLVKLKEEVL